MSDGLAIVLTALDEDLRNDQETAVHNLDAAREQSSRLDQLLASATELAGEPTAPRAASLSRPETIRAGRSGTDDVAESWEQLRRSAADRLSERGTRLDEMSLDDLLDAEEVHRIESRFTGSFELRCDLDRYDVCASITAGLVAALVDFVLVRIPTDTLRGAHGLSDSFLDKGSPLTKWMQTHTVPQDNQLSHWCKASFDKVNLKGTGYSVPGLGPSTHRYHTLGHDPLLGIVFGTIDIMRGSLTGIDSAGNPVSLPNVGAAHPVLALPIEILHLLSDVLTPMGLPAPGWVLTGLAQFGSIGDNELTVGEVARQMCIKGYDSRHFLTMATSPAAAELFLRGYWGLRHHFDGEFAEAVDHAAGAAQTDGHLGGHPRYIGMTLVAHTVASAANAGKIAMYGPAGPYAFNYAQWLAFVKAAVRMFQIKTRSASRLVMGQLLANEQALARGWPDINWADQDSPSLV